MKKTLAFFLVLALLCLGGCSGVEEDKTSSVSDGPMTVTVQNNIYEPDFFTNLYQKIGEKLGAGEEDFMSFTWQNFFFSDDGTIKEIFNFIYTKIPTVENPQNIYTDYSYTAYNLLSNPLCPSELIFTPTDLNFDPQPEHPDRGYDYSEFREQMAFLTNIHLEEIVEQYTVGNPTGYGLCAQPISTNYEDDFMKNGVFLDCTNPSNIKQMEPLPFSKAYDTIFDGIDIKYYYGIFPYYQPDLTGDEMHEEYYEGTEWDNIIILICRK